MEIILYRMIVQRRVASSSNRGAGREKVHLTTTTTPTNPFEEEVEEEVRKRYDPRGYDGNYKVSSEKK
jgi:hypothetical protein